MIELGFFGQVLPRLVAQVPERYWADVGIRPRLRRRAGGESLQGLHAGIAFVLATTMKDSCSG